jgi:hypothetical protein
LLTVGRLLSVTGLLTVRWLLSVWLLSISGLLTVSRLLSVRRRLPVTGLSIAGLSVAWLAVRGLLRVATLRRLRGVVVLLASGENENGNDDRNGDYRMTLEHGNSSFQDGRRRSSTGQATNTSVSRPARHGSVSHWLA